MRPVTYRGISLGRKTVAGRAVEHRRRRGTKINNKKSKISGAEDVARAKQYVWWRRRRRNYKHVYNIIIRTCDEREESAQGQRDGYNCDGRLHVADDDDCRGNGFSATNERFRGPIDRRRRIIVVAYDSDLCYINIGYKGTLRVGRVACVRSYWARE